MKILFFLLFIRFCQSKNSGYIIKELESLKNEVKELWKENKELRVEKRSVPAQQGPILFHAVKTTTTSVTYKRVIVYDQVTTNLGNAYDGNTGIFTAPVKGIYLFTTHVGSSPGNTVHVALVRDGDVIGQGWTYGDVATITRPVLIDAGDKVWIWHIRHTPETVYASWSQFSGTLLRLVD